MKLTFRAIHLWSLPIALALISCTTAPPATVSPPAPPNFVVIVTDDQSWVGSSLEMLPGDSRSKSDYYRTPNIERLAEKGMVFSQGYAPAAKCNPTRRALLVGRTPARHIYSRDRDNWTALYRDYLTIPRMLKEADPRYRTAHFGKWDMRYDKPTPEELGYDVSDGNTGNTIAGTRNSGGPAASPDPKLIGGVTQRAMDFVRKQHASGNPFYVQLSHYAVHLDIYYHEETLAKAKQWPVGTRHNMPAFAAMTSDLDTGIGRFMEFLASLGLPDNTYVFLLSDNGGRADIPGQVIPELPRNFPLRGAKSNIYEGGIRVPFMVTGPGVAQGITSTTTVTGLDILPTIAQLAGYSQTLPAELDGGSLVPVLANAGVGTVRRNHDFVFFHQAVNEPLMTALIADNYKLVKSTEAGLELFDLSSDLGEQNNLIDSLPQKAATLMLQMENFLREVDAETVRERPPKKKHRWKMQSNSKVNQVNLGASRDARNSL